MVELLPLPEVPVAQRTPVVEELLRFIAAQQEQIAAQQEQIHCLREEVQSLKEEVSRLKKHPRKPDLSPSALNREAKKKKRDRRGSKKKKKRKADKTEVIKAKDVPEGSQFKGYADFTVQELVIETRTTRYRLEKWKTPDGQLLIAGLPDDVHQGHFGSTLVCFVLYQYYHAQVTEPLILEQLHEWGVEISSGQVHRMIVEGNEKFHEEKDEILRVGLLVSSHIHVDDTGARHKGKNGYCTHIGNDTFAWFETTSSKSRINFLELLRAGRTDYVLNGEALEYILAQKMPKRVLGKLASLKGRDFADKPEWTKALADCGIHKPRHRRIATEGALLGSVLEHGLHPKLVIVSDDAGQFNVLLHALCWIHAERLLAKLVGFNDEQREALEQIRTAVWELYRDLKAYRASPTDDKRAALEDRFDDLCATQTCFSLLNKALARMGRNKSELLLVLERPDLPLHNNLSEGDIREYVKRRKVSGGTRSEDGRRGRDTFASLKKTCRKHGISFWNYLLDRIRGAGLIPALPRLIEAHAQSP